MPNVMYSFEVLYDGSLVNPILVAPVTYVFPKDILIAFGMTTFAYSPPYSIIFFPTKVCNH